jgi:hypothetical protein
MGGSSNPNGTVVEFLIQSYKIRKNKRWCSSEFLIRVIIR